MRFADQITNLKLALCMVAVYALSGCVSDTLSVENTQATPQPLAQNVETENVSYNPAQREQAIAEIRAKVANSATPELTNAYAVADNPNKPLTPAEQAAKLEELKRIANSNASRIPDAELDAKQRSIRELQARANSHYDNAVSRIEN